VERNNGNVFGATPRFNNGMHPKLFFTFTKYLVVTYIVVKAD